MDTPIRSLHHVTATVDDAQADLDFCREALGLRLVKKTVNFDNHSVYHFYYGDERGTPGTIWTTFPYRGKGVAPGLKGAGQITATALAVPPSSLPFWRRRLTTAGLLAEDHEDPFGDERLRAIDPSGLWMDLVATDADSRAPWTGGGVPAESAITGLHSVTLTIREPGPSVRFLTDVLGFEVVNEAASATRLATGHRGPGTLVDLLHAPDAPPARNGLGTVHHVAFAVDDDTAQLAIRDMLVAIGVQVTPVMDRQYFRSIYFREPGGVLYEIATIPPGFTLDEDLASLGTDLKLPPWEEPHRAEIEAALPRVTV
jgi:glyoxalase family protein